MRVPPADANAQEKTRFWNYENRLVLIFTAGGGVYGLDALAIFYVMPFIVQDLQLDNAHVGMLSFALLIGWSISSPTVSAASDKLGRRKPFLVGVYLMFAACSALGALARSFTPLFVSRMLMGVAEGPAVPLQQAIVAAESSPHRRALNMGITQNFGSQLFGALLGPLLMVQLALTVGWRAAFLLSGVPGLIIAILIVRFVREPVRTAARIGETALSSEERGGRLLEVFRSRTIWLAALASTAIASWTYLMITFLPLWSVQTLHVSPRVMSIVMSMMGVGGVSSAVIMPWLAERLDRRAAMVLASGLGVLAPLAALWTGAPTALLMLGVLVGSMANAMYPLCCTVAVEAAPPHCAAMASAVVYTICTAVGGVAGPLTAGFLADRYGLATTLWMAVGMATVAAGVSATVGRGRSAAQSRLGAATMTS